MRFLLDFAFGFMSVPIGQTARNKELLFLTCCAAFVCPKAMKRPLTDFPEAQ
jgi:hypothetical protein